MNQHTPIVEEIHVRVGTPGDVHRMMELALPAAEENGFANPSPAKLLEHIWAALNLHHGIIGIIGEPGEIIEAAVLLRSGTPWYSDEEILEEKSIFVHPDFRSAKGGRAARLLEFSKQASEMLKLPLAIGVLSDERAKAKVRLYTRKLGEPKGAFWLYNSGKWSS